MATATRITSNGDTVPYTPSTAVSVGDVVVLGALVCVACHDIAASAAGSLSIRGRFQFPKQSSAVIEAGGACYWDATNSEMSPEPDDGVFAGFSPEGAAGSDSTVEVILNHQASDNEGVPPALRDLTWEDVDDNITLDVEDVGKVMNVTVDAKTVTLPATDAQFRFIIRNGGADGTIGVTVSPHGDDKLMGADHSGTDDKDIVNTKATAQHGDYIVLEGDGADGYQIHQIRGTWAHEA